MSHAQLFFASHQGRTYSESLSDVDAYLAYAVVDSRGVWLFEDGSRLVPEVMLHQVWAANGQPVVRLVPYA